MPSSARNIVTEVKAERLHHPKEAFNRKPDGNLVPPSLQGSKEDGQQRKLPSSKGPLLPVPRSLEALPGKHEDKEKPPTRGHRPETAATCSEAAGKKISPFSTPEGNLGHQADSLRGDSSLSTHQTGNPIRLPTLMFLIVLFLWISRVSPTHGKSSLCETPHPGFRSLSGGVDTQTWNQPFLTHNPAGYFGHERCQKRDWCTPN